MASAGLIGLVGERLASNPPGVPGADALVLAAFAGADDLDRAIAGGATTAVASPATAPLPPAVFLRSLAVEGFRGVGPPVALNLMPGHGLTLIVGRNGSGKSSLAEALEMLLSGANRRWQGRSAVWTEGWRNLHHSPPRITATFAVDGRSAPMTVTRTWAAGAALGASTLEIDGRQRGLNQVGWAQALLSFPPLLSHNELGRVLEGKPTELYDSLAAILGLGDIAAAEAALRTARLAAETAIRTAQREADRISSELAQMDDERGARVIVALGATPPDVAAVNDVVAGGVGDVAQRSDLRVLRELTALPVLDRERVRHVSDMLREVDEELARVGGSDAAASRDTARLLEMALAVHAPHEGLDCPVCGTAGVLTYEWRLRATERIAALTEAAASVEAVHRRADQATAEARSLVLPAPPALSEAASVGVDTTAAVKQWQRWSAVPPREAGMALSVHLDTVAPDLIAAVAAVRAAAATELERREDRWRPQAQALVAWLPLAHRAAEARGALERVRAAESWLGAAHKELRRERFLPIADQVQTHWRELRQNSSIQLGDLRLEGTATANTRRLTLDVTIDGDNASALGVMSQGELNCLALSLFLPRAAMPESPFRFMVIDDPVQAMDPVKVEGLARVLGLVSADRQVVVLTHDDRLPEAVRRLEMDATIIEVSRRDHSVVDLRRVFDPVKRHIDDAMAVAQTSGLPAEARRVVPGFCRLALEAACAAAITRSMMHRGIAHSEIDAALAAPTTLRSWLAQALLGDAGRAADVQGWLQREQPWAATTVHQLNRGSHAEVPGDLIDLVRTTERLCAVVEARGRGGA